MNLISKIKNRIVRKTRRIYSIYHAYDFPPVNDGWEKYGKPVLGGGKEGIFFDPYVTLQDGKFEMYVSHRDNNSIKKYSSDDGVKWENGITVLTGSHKNEWEKIVNRASVLKKDHIWYMWYTGQNENQSMVGLATSKDGIHFERYEGNPVFIPSETYELQSVMNPCVMWDENEKIFKMWYSAGEKYEPDVLCYATSEDGIHWTKYKDNPIFQKSSNEYDKAKVGGCDVIKQSDTYMMFYIGYQNIDNARICVAESFDGIHWNRKPNNPIIAPSKNSWDAHAVYKPAVAYDEKQNQYLLWYNGRKGTKEYIGLAYNNKKK